MDANHYCHIEKELPDCWKLRVEELVSNEIVQRLRNQPNEKMIPVYLTQDGPVLDQELVIEYELGSEIDLTCVHQGCQRYQTETVAILMIRDAKVDHALIHPAIFATIHKSNAKLRDLQVKTLDYVIVSSSSWSSLRIAHFMDHDGGLMAFAVDLCLNSEVGIGTVVRYYDGRYFKFYLLPNKGFVLPDLWFPYKVWTWTWPSFVPTGLIVQWGQRFVDNLSDLAPPSERNHWLWVAELPTHDWQGKVDKKRPKSSRHAANLTQPTPVYKAVAESGVSIPLREIMQHPTVQSISHLDHEVFIPVFITETGYEIAQEYIVEGNESSVTVATDENINRIVAGCQRFGAKTLITMHNHPPRPGMSTNHLNRSNVAYSRSDLYSHMRMVKMLAKHGIKVADEVIVTTTEWFSFFQHRLIDTEGCATVRYILDFYNSYMGLVRVLIRPHGLFDRIELYHQITRLHGENEVRKWTDYPFWSFSIPAHADNIIWPYAVLWLNDEMPWVKRLRHWTTLMRGDAEAISDLADEGYLESKWAWHNRIREFVDKLYDALCQRKSGKNQ